MKKSMTEDHRYLEIKLRNTARIKIGLLMLATALILTTSVVHESIAGPDLGSAATGEMRQGTDQKSPAGKTEPPETMAIGVRDFVRLVMEKNERIAFQNSEWAISREGVKGAKAIFEPAFVSSINYQEDKRKNTIQEFVSQSSAREFQERSRNYQAAVEGLVPTGARLRMGYTLKDFSNSIEDRYGVDQESQTVFGASITQPLLKGGGVKATMAGIEVAQTDAEIAFQNYRAQTMRIVSEAIASYWDLYLAREKYRIRKESEENASEILRENRVRVKTGKMSETEVLEAEAGLALRRSLVSDAQQNIVYAKNRIRSYFSSSAAVEKADIRPTDSPHPVEAKPDFADSLSRAFNHRADYLASRKKIEREDIRLVFAENQRWPQLDLKGSYNMNGLTETPRSSWNDAWDRDYETWYLGIELRIPLGGDRKSRSELEATRQRKKQALLELKAMEVSLANDTDTAIKGVENVWEQARQYAGIVEMNRKLLEAENVKFKAGKSNSRLLLEREEELNKAKEAEIDSLVRYRKSLLQLEMAEGSVLANQGIEVSVGDPK